jgi:glycosyltransferase involved in cell wall biosynthesis
MPKISIITPTKDREHFMPAIWDCVQAQTIQDFEWLIHDGSAQPSHTIQAITDCRIRYFHDPKPMKIGAKRNALCQAAVGDTIIHFDDDDYYAPGYVEAMLTLLSNENVDIVKLYGFFLYHQRTRQYAYWDLEHGFPLHAILHPHLSQVYWGPKQVNPNDHWGYGFSYVYKRAVWLAQPFPDHDHGEDKIFTDAAIANFKHAGMQDRQFLMVHVIHDSNSSVSYPQQLLQLDLGPTYFPDFIPPP